MELWHAPLLTLVGLLAGWLNVMAGGGSLLTVPAMLFIGLPGPVANGTNRIAILAQNIMAVSTFRRNGLSDFKLSITLALAASLGAIGGAFIGVQLSGEWFSRILAAIMIGVLILMLAGGTSKKKSQVSEKEPGAPKRLLLGHILMIGAGIWGGFIQIGVGFILMPILSRVMGLDLVRVNMHKVFIVLIYTPIALVVYASQIELEWLAGASLALGNAAGGWLGARTTMLKGDALIRRVFMAAVLALVIKLIFFP